MTFKEILNEIIVKPTKEDKKKHDDKKGKLHYVVKSKKGKNLGFIDDEYIKKIGAKSPKQAAHKRLGQVEFFKKAGK